MKVIERYSELGPDGKWDLAILLCDWAGAASVTTGHSPLFAGNFWHRLR